MNNSKVPQEYWKYDDSFHKYISGECNKVVYQSKRDAVTKKNWIEKTRGSRLRAYSCETCGGWHLTKSL